ncbi:MAG: hypothetical protein AB1746_05815 [Candidatus Zixiibacteriota bacterium]
MNDTLAFGVPMQCDNFIIYFKSEDSIAFNYDTVEDGVNISADSAGLRINWIGNSKNLVINVILSNGTSFFIKLNSLWRLEGYYKYNDPFGTNNNPIGMSDCFFYEWFGDHFERVEVSWTYSDGYFSFWTDKDTVLVSVMSSSGLAYTFYAEDSCFDFSIGETMLYHTYAIRVINLSHIDYMIP